MFLSIKEKQLLRELGSKYMAIAILPVTVHMYIRMSYCLILAWGKVVTK